MTDSKKTKPAKSAKKRQPPVDAPAQGFVIGLGNEAEQDAQPKPWAKWNVKPDLSSMFASIITNPPEAGIGKRIAYCRGQLDNLSVEALARYTKNFDPDGISRTTIVRYESGDNLPGGRELRILSDALWVPVDWLIWGRAESSGVSSEDIALLEALDARILRRIGHGDLADMTKGLAQRDVQDKIEQRRKWLYEARQPKPRE